MMIIYIATSNEHKVKEFTAILREGHQDVTLRFLDTIGGMGLVDETEDSFEGNARLKIRALRKNVPEDVWVLADDSGLEVDFLNGKPGVLSARYAGDSATYEENNRKLLSDLEGVVKQDRSARFVCCLVLHGPCGGEHIFRGMCQGAISMSPRGGNGFGYDPIFVPADCVETFAEMDAKRKDAISHRARAIESLQDWLATNETLIN